MHWEYQERDFYHLQNAWRCRPDGSNMDAFYKQHISVPYSIRDVQQVPDSRCAWPPPRATTILTAGRSSCSTLRRASTTPTPCGWSRPVWQAVEGGLGPLYQQVVPEGGVENRGGSYINPFPMSDKAFLVGHDHGRRRPLYDAARE